MPQIEDSPRWVRIYKEKQLIADSKRVKLDYSRGAYCFPLEDINVDPKTVKGASPVPDLPDHYSFDWEAMDAWFEEDEQVFVHPRMPNHRTDCIQSSRHIEVVIDGVKVADTHRPTLLFETGLPTRYYIPQHDCRLELLEKLEFGKKLKMWGLMNVVEIWRCNARTEKVMACEIVSESELEKLKEDLLNASC